MKSKALSSACTEAMAGLRFVGGGSRPLEGGGRPLDGGGRPIDVSGRSPVVGRPETGDTIPPEAGGAWLPPGRACDPMGRMPHGGIG